MIDEKKLIEELEEMIGMLPTIYLGKKKEENAYLDAITRVLSAVKNQPKFGEWTPCSVGMPDEHDSVFAKFKGTDRWNSAMFEKKSYEVIVAYEYEDGTRKVSSSKTLDGVWKMEKEYAGAGLGLKVIAWMPLPEPYKGEK